MPDDAVADVSSGVEVDASAEQPASSSSADLSFTPPSAEKLNTSEVRDAIKRKLVDFDERRRAAEKRAAALEQKLSIEKREHQRTTTKLSALLKKRGASGHDDENESELNSLRQSMAAFQLREMQQQQREKQLRAELTEWRTRCAAHVALPARARKLCIMTVYVRAAQI